jgi:hypothetical protein
MKSFAAACLAVSAEALLKAATTAKVTGASAPFDVAGGVKATTFEWGYDAANLYINVTTGVISKTAMSADNDLLAIHAYFGFDANTATSQIALGCESKLNNTNSTQLVTWSVWKTAGTVFAASPSGVYSANTALDVSSVTKKTQAYSAAGALNTTQTLASDTTQVGNQILIAGSTGNMSTDKTTVDCMIKSKVSSIANLATAKGYGETLDAAFVAATNTYLTSILGGSTVGLKV